VRDLPKTRFGSTSRGLGAHLSRSQGPQGRVASLKKHAASAGTVYLAPTPTVKGSHRLHLKEALNLKDDRIRRVTFTKSRSRRSEGICLRPPPISTWTWCAPRRARRFLDRVVGYKLSPLLSQTLAEKLTAGRVQSVAVRVIVERERKSPAFKPEEYGRSAHPANPGRRDKAVKLGATKKPAKPKEAQTDRG